eukprot:gene41215-55742_t
MNRLLVSISLVVLLTACTRNDPTTTAKPDLRSPNSDLRAANTVSAAPAATHPIRGEIVGLDLPRKILLIHHEEIPGYMPAMTMEFSVAGLDLATVRE